VTRTTGEFRNARTSGFTSREVKALIILALSGLSLLPWSGVARAQCAEAVNKLLLVGKTDDARSIIASSLRLRPADDSLMHCQGMIEWSAGNRDLASEWLEKAIKANESSAIHHLALGRVLAQEVSGVSKIRLPFVARRLKSEFERSVALDPTLVGAREGLIGYYLNAPSFFGGSDEQARAQAAEILKLNPMRGHLALALIFSKRGAPAEAEREIIESTRVAPPDSAAAALALGEFYVSQKRWSAAFDALSKGMSDHPRAPWLHYAFGRAAALSGQNLERGESELKQWIAAPANDASIAFLAGAHQRLGSIYRQQGRDSDARAELEAALAIDPKNLAARAGLDSLKGPRKD
jgi:tetratricopeptide (TPR) repeat protein